MKYTFMYLFTCYLHNLMPLVKYVEKIKGSLKHPLINLLVYYFFSPTNFWALQILPPLIEISSSRFVRKGITLILFSEHMHKQRNLSMRYNSLTKHRVNRPYYSF
jgi:hypothetical protein